VTVVVWPASRTVNVNGVGSADDGPVTSPAEPVAEAWPAFAYTATVGGCATPVAAATAAETLTHTDALNACPEAVAASADGLIDVDASFAAPVADAWPAAAFVFESVETVG
jgi:hypothetical protein